ncbi:SCO family protein [Reinekea thalattae]|uniref:SCO family protein n=1 Tax=Reinekea thalattae TaxID=2593301 RepID=A0A5C8Z6U2_9GAMM|nr:SCO family protein [Reinekea thalattae]TXR53815.1 SCO family protein [Reinekea thalattae]
MKMNPARWAILAGGIFIAIILALYLSNITVPVGERQKSLDQLGGRFQLTSLNGPIDTDDYLGKTLVLYFGFLNCAEVCPSSMGVMSTAFRLLEPDAYEQVQGFFISVDPGRDDYQSLYDFSQYFDKRILGLTGTQAEVDSVTDMFGVYVDIVEMESSVLSYTVDHSSRFFVIDPNGQLVDAMSHSTTPVELAARIERVIESNSVNTQD